MPKLVLRTFAVIFSIAAMCLFFQNCSGQNFAVGESATSGSSTLGSSSTGNQDHQSPHISPVSTNIAANVDIEFSVTAESMLPSLSYLWSHTLNGTASVCALKNGNKATTYIINCAQSGTLNVGVTITEGSTPTTLTAYSVVLPGAATTTGEINMQVVFNIPAGTGATPWNAQTALVETFVGQTLKIVNMDSVTHQMHTGGKPCGHGSAMASGVSTNCVISKAYDMKTNGALYDHNLGTKSAFYMVAYDGAVLYANNCASCHGALASSTHAGAKVSAIKNALANVPTMKANANLMNLTPRQIEAISFALGAK